MAKRGYKVCWSYKGSSRKTCRTLSSKQHRNSREAAETVLMRNPSAIVRVTSPKSRSGTTFKRSRKTGRAVRA